VRRLFLLYIICVLISNALPAQNARMELESLVQECSVLISNEEDTLAFQKLELGLKKAIKKFGQQDTTTAKFQHKLGAASYNLYEFESALENYSSALKTRNALLDRNHPSIAELHYLIGVYYYDSDLSYNPDSTIHHLNKAIEIQQKKPTIALGRSYRTLAQLHLENSDEYNALNYFRSAKDLLPNKTAKADLYILIADAFTELNEPDSILHYLSKSRILYESTDLGGYDKLRLSDCYTNLAYFYIDESDYANARRYLNEAREIMEETDDFEGLANVLINLGVVEKREKNLESANLALNEALEIYDKEFPETKLSVKGIIHHNLGDNNMLLGKRDAAISAYQKASENFLENYRAGDIYSTPDIKNEVFITNKNNLLLNFQQLIKAYALQNDQASNQSTRNTYLAIDQVIDKMRQEQVNEDSKLLWRQKTRPIYEDMLSQAYASQDAEFAYQVFEKSKSVILLDALKDETALRIANVPAELTEKLQTTDADISELELNIDDYEDRNEVINALHNLYTDKQRIISKLEKTYPQYYNYKYNSDFINIEKLRSNLLDDNTGLIQYFVGKNHLYSIYITTTDTQLAKIEIPSTFTSQVVQLIRLLSDKDKLEYKDSYAQYENYRASLHALLLGKFNALKTSLIIIPDGIINNIPFEILGASREEQMINKHNISYAYSCNVLEQNNVVKANGKKAVFFAPLEYAHSGLTALKGGTEEANALSQLLDFEKFIGNAASVENFKDNSSDYNILHLSTHAQANDSLDNRSWIAFADSLLYLDQIYSLPINAELIVLSACQTSLGDLVAGEGVMSLARAFTYAGASSSLTSLWEVNEKATQEIIQSFYQEIIAGKTRSEALQNAKTAYQKVHPDASPHYWSGFILLGNPDTINMSSSHSFALYLGFAFVLLMGIGAYFFLKKGKT